MRVVATAGHVDHGKSTLVRALTGSDPDRLAEERRRGLTIELGFCWTELDDGQQLAFVDVPGHERFVTTALAGLGPVPAALLVVAADDGWMPQTAEHVAALEALGVRHGVIAVTRSDLADPEVAAELAREELAGTGLADAPMVPVCAPTGAGLPELRRALTAMLARLPEPALGADVRLWVDRCFTVTGAGTVVTGTLPAGRLAVGDVLETGRGGRVRVRRLESLGRQVPEARGVARVALNLTGDPGTLQGLRRGDVLVSPGAWASVTELDVRLRSPRPGQLPREAVLHLG
uniref:GTP-binding protein n=1 Tax=Ornithinicoccus halotolerans TaxID=1748220 RepID=UPI001885F728